MPSGSRGPIRRQMALQTRTVHEPLRILFRKYRLTLVQSANPVDDFVRRTWRKPTTHVRRRSHKKEEIVFEKTLRKSPPSVSRAPLWRSWNVLPLSRSQKVLHQLHVVCCNRSQNWNWIVLARRNAMNRQIDGATLAFICSDRRPSPLLRSFVHHANDFFAPRDGAKRSMNRPLSLDTFG